MWGLGSSFRSVPISGILPDQVWSVVDLWLDVDVSVARFCDGSDAPLHVLSVEFELCFGDVAVELLDDLGVVCALLVGDVLAGEVRWALAFCLVLRVVLAPVQCVRQNQMTDTECMGRE